jgi:hypothetical protein
VDVSRPQASPRRRANSQRRIIENEEKSHGTDRNEFIMSTTMMTFDASSYKDRPKPGIESANRSSRDPTRGAQPQAKRRQAQSTSRKELPPKSRLPPRPSIKEMAKQRSEQPQKGSGIPKPGPPVLPKMRSTSQTSAGFNTDMEV